MASPVQTPQQHRRSRAPAPRWLAPPSGFAKINVDAEVRKQNNAGAVAAVCRMDDGTFLGASAVSITGSSEPTILEALASREALAMAADLQLEQFRVASDCLEVIKSIDGEYLGRFSSVLHEIKVRRRDFTSVEFKHEQRESNKEAHSLARSLAYLDRGRHVWLIDSPDHSCIPMNLSI